MSIGAAIASLNAALETLKALRGLEKAFDQAVLKAQIVDLMGNVADAKVALLEAQDALREKDAEIDRLNGSIAAKAKLLEGPGGYMWADRGDGIRRGYPVCPACDEKEARQVTLKQAGGAHSCVCPRCDSKFKPVEYFHEPDASGKQQTHSQRMAERRNRHPRTDAQINDWLRR